MAECIEGHIPIIADFDILRYSACLNSRGLSAPKGCIEGHIIISQTSIRMPRHTTQPALIPGGLSGPEGCIEGHFTLSQTSIRMPQHTTQPAEDPWTE